MQALIKKEVKAGKAKDAKALTQKFQQIFPDYNLAYMIEYGAYGLVEQETEKLTK